MATFAELDRAAQAAKDIREEARDAAYDKHKHLGSVRKKFRAGKVSEAVYKEAIYAEKQAYKLHINLSSRRIKPKKHVMLYSTPNSVRKSQRRN